jgi:LL-diaminopimelate aminotransferase
MMVAVQGEGAKLMMGQIGFYKENAQILRETFTALGFSVYGGTDAPYIWVGFPGVAPFNGFP